MRLAIALALLVGSVSLLADEKGHRTENRTGEWWRTLGAEEKEVYLTGLRDGGLLGSLYTLPRSAENSACRPKAIATYLERDAILGSVTTAAISSMVDRFYADPANAKVMIPHAVFYISRQKAGDDKKTLGDLLGSFRKNDG